MTKTNKTNKCPCCGHDELDVSVVTIIDRGVEHKVGVPAMKKALAKLKKDCITNERVNKIFGKYF